MNSRNKHRFFPGFILTIALLSAAMWHLGCQNYEYWSEACDPCIEEEPTDGELIIRFLINDTHTSVPFRVFAGDIENGTLLLSDTSFVGELKIVLPAEKTYSVAATYTRGGETIIVVDAGKIKTRTTNCTDKQDPEVTYSCWYVVPAELDVKLTE